MKRKFEEYMDDDETALAVFAAAQAAAEQAQLFSRKFVKRIVVKQKHVGRVIGKGGETLNGLKRISGVLVDQTTKFQGYSTVIVADDDKKQFDECVRVIDNLVASAEQISGPPLASNDHVLQIPESAVRFVIGPKGQVLKKLREEFDVHVLVSESAQGNKRTVQIFGTSENVTKTKQRIKDILSGSYRPEFADIQNSDSAQYLRMQQNVLKALRDSISTKHERHLLEISEADASLIYGKRGNLLKQLSRQSLAQMIVDNSQVDSGKKLLVIIGPPFAATRAIALVRERLRDPVKAVETPSLDSLQAADALSAAEVSEFSRNWDEYTKSLEIA